MAIEVAARIDVWKIDETNTNSASTQIVHISTRRSIAPIWIYPLTLSTVPLFQAFRQFVKDRALENWGVTLTDDQIIISTPPVRGDFV